MASLDELHAALINADKAGDKEAATALASEIVRLRMSQPGNPARTAAFNQVKDDAITAIKAPVIAAGKSADDVVQGVNQLGLAANVAGREALGMQSGDQLRRMAELDAEQKDKAQRYQPLKEAHPFLTGAGEAFPLMATPMGQATALGRIAAPAVAGTAMGALGYGSPQERGMKAVEMGATSAGGGALGELGRMIVSPAKSTLSAAQQRALERAGKTIGYTPRASELTGSETLRRLEDAVARQPGGAGPMRDLMAGNEAAVSRHAAKAIGEKDIPTEDVLANASSRLSSTYDDLRSRTTMPVVQDVFDGIAKAEKFLGTGDKAGAKKEAFDMIQRLKDELYQAKQFDGQTYQSWTSDLGAKARELGKTNRTAAAALREVEKAMDKVARGADAEVWQAADKQNAALEMLMKPGVVNSQTGQVSSQKLAGQMERQFGKNMKTGKIQGELADIASLGRALPPMHEGSQTAGREAFGSLPGWLLALPNYALAKGLTSEAGRDYLARGLLGNAAVSRGAGGLLSKGSMPLTIAEIESLLLGYQ